LAEKQFVAGDRTTRDSVPPREEPISVNRSLKMTKGFFQAAILLATLLWTPGIFGESKFASLGANEKVTMRFVFPGSSEGEKQFAANFKKYYEAKNPNVTVDFLSIPGGELLQKLSIMGAAGDMPDVITVLDVGDLAAMKVLEPLDSYFAKDARLKKDLFSPGSLQYSQIDGTTFAVPLSAIGYGLMVNTNLLAKTKYKLEDLKTWDDLLKASAAMTVNGVSGYGFCGVTPRFMFRDFYIAALSNGITLDKLTDPANKKKFLELLAFYKKLQPTIVPNFISLEWSDAHKYVIDNRMAFLTTGTYYQSYMTGLNGDCIEYIKPIAYPRGPSATAATAYVTNSAQAIAVGSKHKEIAWDMIREIHLSSVGPEFTGSIHTPANLTYDQAAVKQSVAKYFGSHLDAQMEILGRWSKIMAKGIPQPVVLGQADIERTYQKRMTLFLLGKTDVEQTYTLWMDDLHKIQADLVKK